MIPALVWLVCGIVVAVTVWAFAPPPRMIGVAPMLSLGAGGGVFGGLLAWTFWQFPATTFATSDILSTPALTSYLMAALGAMTTLSTSLGVVMHER